MADQPTLPLFKNLGRPVPAQRERGARARGRDDRSPQAPVPVDAFMPKRVEGRRPDQGVPMHTLPRSVVVRPRMASESFLRDIAPGLLQQVERELAAVSPKVRETAVPLPVPGYEIAAIDPGQPFGVVAVFETATGRCVGGCLGATIHVDPAHRGRGLGAEILIYAFERGIKHPSDGAFFSPEGYANRSAAHRRAVARALASGLEVPREVLRDYPDLVGGAGLAKATPSPGAAAKAITGPDTVDTKLDGLAEMDLASLASLSEMPKATTAALPAPGRDVAPPSARELVRLRHVAGRYATAASFVEAEMGRLPPLPEPTWTVRDSHGVAVITGKRGVEARYSGIREYRIERCPADAAAMAEHAAHLDRRDRLAGLWSGWDELGTRGFAPIMVAQRLPGGALIERVAAAVGAELLRAVPRDSALPYAPNLGGRGFELLGPLGRVYFDARFKGREPQVLVLSQIAVERGGQGLGRTILEALRDEADACGGHLEVQTDGAPGFFAKFAWLKPIENGSGFTGEVGPTYATANPGR